MSKISPLYSSSSGNSTYIGTKNGGILIDAGASFKGINEKLLALDTTAKEILAVAVTHEHIDHIKGLKTFLKNSGASLIASADTLNALAQKDCIPKNTKIIVSEERAIDICGIEIKRFGTSHDCVGSSGYTLTLPDNKKVAVCTDLGVMTDTVQQAIIGSDLVLLESNHDIEMLKKGPYPPQLKVRILSDKGHLSNNICAAELKTLLQNGTKRFILGHLSQHNNTPLLAKSCATAALMDLGAKIDKDYLLYVATPNNNGVSII